MVEHLALSSIYCYLRIAVYLIEQVALGRIRERVDGTIV